MFRMKRAIFLFAAILAWAEAAYSQQSRFHLQEATINDIHRAIRDGQITCRGLVQLYINRAKAYNGVSDMLVTRDGAPILPVSWGGSRRLAAQVSYADNRHIRVCSPISISMPARPLSLAGWNRPRPIRLCSNSTA